jgi:hypothetical protein
VRFEEKTNNGLHLCFVLFDFLLGRPSTQMMGNVVPKRGHGQRTKLLDTLTQLGIWDRGHKFG